MNDLDFSDIATGMVAVFFLAGAAINFYAPPSIRADYDRWGYPSWFNYVTASLEIAVAATLFTDLQAAGALLGVFVMLAAIATTIFHREFKRAIAPSIALTLSAVVLFCAI